MIVKEVKVQPLTQEAFEPFGQVIGPQETEPTVTLPVLRYWHDISGIRQLGIEGVSGYLVTHHRDFSFGKMERHVKSIEVFIPIEGCSIFPLAPPTDLDDPNAMPNPDEVTAFILEGTKGVTLNVGVWHWAPFPLGDVASFILFLKRKTVDEDIDTKDLEKLKGLSFKLAL